MIELLFCLPISNAAVERLFSLMKRLKTSIRSSLGQTRLSNIIRIKLHGPSLSEFDPTAAIDRWFKKCTRRMSEQNRKPYKSQKELGKKVKVLIDEPLSEEEN